MTWPCISNELEDNVNNLAMNPYPHISVVIPVYQAEHCLDELYLRLKTALESISPDFEIVLVEDCGGGSSWDMIARLARRGS